MQRRSRDRRGVSKVPVPCTVCGALVAQTATVGRTKTRHDACRPPALRTIPIACRQCGRPARVGERGPRAAYCSIRCQKQAGSGVGSERPPCFRCGRRTRLHRQPGRRAFCSVECGQRQHAHEARLANARRLATRPRVVCLWCSAAFRPKRTGHRFCSAACRNRGTDRLSNARRAGLGEVRTVLRREIYDRDGWRCHLCRRRVDRRLRHPHPRSASLDHLIPLADGGDHDPANLATAHLGCNMARRRGGNVQLRALA